MSIMLLLFLLINNQRSHALSVETHEYMNGHIATSVLNGFSLDDYLYANLGFEKGAVEQIAKQTTVETTTGPITETTINTVIKEVYKWFVDGGRYEDLPPATFPYLRSNNHLCLSG